MVETAACPWCGEEFRTGGTYQTHVGACDERDAESDESPLSERVRALAGRVETLEVELREMRSGVEQSAESAEQTAESAVGRVDTLEDRLDTFYDRLDTLRGFAKSAAGCPQCGKAMKAPDSPGEHDCPHCGATLRFAPTEIPPEPPEAEPTE